MRHLPNLLTLARIGVAALAAALLDTAPWVSFGLALTAAATDWLDGALARRFGWTSALGRILDPIADKLVVLALGLGLAGAGRLAPEQLALLFLILAREFAIAALREQLAAAGQTLPVSRGAKLKTASQFAALVLLLPGPAGTPWLALAGGAMLWVAAGLTLATGADYWRQAGPSLKG